jgi:hypothetical protein
MRLNATSAAPHAQIDQPDQRPAVRLGRGQFAFGFFGSRAVRAPRHDAAQQSGHGEHHQLQVEPNHAEQECNQQDAANGHGDPPRQDEFAAVLNSGSEFFDLRLEAHNLLMRIDFIPRHDTSGDYSKRFQNADTSSSEAIPLRRAASIAAFSSSLST